MVQTNNETGITRALGNFARELEYEDLSPEVIDWAKYLCLDFAAVTLNGSTTGSAQAVVDALQRLGRPGPSVIAGTPHRVLPEYASMANGIAFHSIEMDDVNNEASLHPGVVAFPTALSMADLAQVSGKDFIAAVVAGYDVIVRLGRALQPAEHYGRGFHPTGTCGAFGAAVVAGRLLGLHGDDFIHALGIAGRPDRGQHGIPGAGGVDQAVPPRLGLAQRLLGCAAGPLRLHRTDDHPRGPRRVPPGLFREPGLLTGATGLGRRVPDHPDGHQAPRLLPLQAGSH